MLRHQHHSMQSQLRDQSRMVGPTRQMSQGSMMPPHQPHHMHIPHRGMHAPHQQIISLAGHQPMHHIQHSGPRQPLLIGTTTQNPNGTMVNVGVNRQSDAAVPASLQNQTVVQYQYQGGGQQGHQPAKAAEQSKSPTRDASRESESRSPSGNNNAPVNLANMKEKTPMCLVNELARFNRIQHQYRLTNEQGPAHKKCFTVTLKLGEEEYVADGPSIKKAQHSAATEALTKTLYIQPPPKPRALRIGHSGKCSNAGTYTSHLPPTVELNALAMKRGEATVYTSKHAPLPPNAPFVGHDLGNITPDLRMFHPHYQRMGRLYNGKPEGLYVVTLKVGEREFTGQGLTGQAARHDAASRALEQLRNLPLPEAATQIAENGSSGIDDPNAELKSPVSLVHETALKHGLSVTFEVVSETGKPHIRTFSTKCIVGEKVALGEGSSKKVSKKHAAELMLEELKRLPPLPATNQCRTVRVKRKPPATKKKSRNLIKDYQEPRSESDAADEVNPISRLVQIQQAKKEREPVYTLIEEKGAPRRREFLMEVSIGQYSAQGIGPNKKMGKRAAADALLAQLGYTKPQAQPENTDSKPRKVTFLEDDKQHQNDAQSHPVGGTIGRQLVPGLLLVDGGQDGKISSGPSVQAVAEELREQQQSSLSGISPKEQLKYLAQLLNFQVEFSDFPKGMCKEYLSLVSLNTDPPQVCHGHGPTTSASRDQAARTALRTLRELGLDSVTNTQKKEKPVVEHTNQPKNILNQAIDK